MSLRCDAQSGRWPAGSRVKCRTHAWDLPVGEGTYLWPPLFEHFAHAAWEFAEKHSGGAIDQRDPLTLKRSVVEELNATGGRDPECFRAVSALFLSEQRLFDNYLGAGCLARPLRLVFWPDPEKRRNVLEWIESSNKGAEAIRQDSVSLRIRSNAFRPISLSIDGGGDGDYVLLQCLYPLEVRFIRPRSARAYSRAGIHRRKGDENGDFHWHTRDLEAVFGPQWQEKVETVALDAGGALLFHPRTPIDFDKVPPSGAAKIVHLSLVTQQQQQQQQQSALAAYLEDALYWCIPTLHKHCPF